MTKTLRRVLWALGLLAIGLLPLTAAAGPITFTESFMASGTVNGNQFNANVTLSLTSDTTQIIQDGNLFLTPQGMATVTIQGIGSGTLADLFNVFDNQGNAVAGFTDDAFEDFVDLSNSAFATYDLKSPIGPLDSTFFFVDTGQPIGSSLGVIIIDSVSGTPTFEASQGKGTTPEPSSLVLFGSGLLGLATVVRRRLRL